eukprot:5802514-Prorocentrum_lima.AAC.1
MSLFLYSPLAVRPSLCLSSGEIAPHAPACIRRSDGHQVLLGVGARVVVVVVGGGACRWNQFSQ